MGRSQPLLHACGLFRRKGFAPRIRRRRGKKPKEFGGGLRFEQCERRLALDAADGSDGGFLVVAEAHGGSGAGIVLDAGTGVPSGITPVTGFNLSLTTATSLGASGTWYDELILNLRPSGNGSPANAADSVNGNIESTGITLESNGFQNLTADSTSGTWWQTTGASVERVTFAVDANSLRYYSAECELTIEISPAGGDAVEQAASITVTSDREDITSSNSGEATSSITEDVSATDTSQGSSGSESNSKIGEPNNTGTGGAGTFATERDTRGTTSSQTDSSPSHQPGSISRNVRKTPADQANSEDGEQLASNEPPSVETNTLSHHRDQPSLHLIKPARGEKFALRGPSFEVAVLSPDQISDGGFLSLPEVVAQTRSIEQSHFAALALHTPQQNPLFEDADSRLSVNPVPDVARASVFEVAAVGSVFAAPEKLMRSPAETAEDPSAAAKAPAAKEFGLQTPTRTRKQDHHYVSTAMEAALTAVFAAGIFWADESLRSASSISNQQRDARSAQKRRPW